jgi:hypothetical protein
MSFSLDAHHPDRKRGNMMVMVALVVGLIVLFLLIGVGLLLVFSSSSKAKNAADELAIGAAKVLNSDDRQGRINILSERSRELVFSSRKTYNDLTRHVRHLEPIARQLADEARSGAQKVEEERLAILAQAEIDLGAALKDDAKRLAERSSMNLNWLKATTPRLIACDVGTLKDSDSNVLMPEGFEELKVFDLERNYINRKSKLYKGNIDVRLPSPDDDLHFRFSALPAPVKGTISGARLLSDEKYEQQSTIDLQTQKVSFAGKIPCAVRLKLSTQVTASGRGDLSGNVANSSVALTDGGTPAPDEEP